MSLNGLILIFVIQALMKSFNSFFMYRLSIKTEIFISEVEMTFEYLFFCLERALNILYVTLGVVIIPTNN